jgi:mannitol-specific phosphotransferase system IIBC component
MSIDITAVLGTFAALVASFWAITKVLLTQASKDRESDRSERKELSKAIKDMAGATGRVADASQRAADEAKERNGHLAELVMQSKKDGERIANSAVSEIIDHIDKQQIKEQTVEHQHVKSKEVE